MKNALLFCFILLTYFSAQAQSSLEVKGYFGISGANVASKVDVDGAGSGSGNNLKEFGISLSKRMSEDFRLNGGLNYVYGNTENRVNHCPLCNDVGLPYPYNQDFKMLSVPVYAEYMIGKLFYVAAGPIFDFQLSEGNNFSDQSGIGYLVGLGAKLETGKLSFSIFPNYKRHGVIPFEDSDKYKHVLQELGLQFGVGYKF